MKLAKKLLESIPVNEGSMQYKLMDELGKTVHGAGLEFDVEGGYANTGKVYIRSGFDTLAVGQFNFQSEYAILGFSKGEKLKHPANMNKNDVGNSYLEYSNSKELKKFIADFQKMVASLKKK